MTEDAPTQKCPFCAERILLEAIKCKHCGEFLNRPRPGAGVPWYFKGSAVVVAFLCVGPLALPLVWFHPRMGRAAKILITLITLVLSYFLTVAFIRSTKELMSYYKELQETLGDLPR